MTLGSSDIFQRLKNKHTQKRITRMFLHGGEKNERIGDIFKPEKRTKGICFIKSFKGYHE